jgi:hypothetical protein
MNSVKCATLVLKSCDITNDPNFNFNYTDYSGERGSINKSLSSITWNNINLRQVLGDMYDEYEEFNLVLKQVASNQSNSRFEGNPFNSRGVYIRLYGLPFLNCTYDVVTRTNRPSTILGAFNIPTAGWVSQLFSDTMVTFGKSQFLCNLTIELCEIADDDLIFFGDPIPQPGNEIGDTFFTVNMTFVANSSTLTNAGGGGLNANNTFYAFGDGIPRGSQIVANSTGTPGTFTINKRTLQESAPGGTTVSFYCAMPLFIFIFDIYGIPKDKNNLNNSRI